MDGIAYHAFVEGADLPDGRDLRAAPELGGAGQELIEALLAADVGRVRLLLERDRALAGLKADGRSLAEIAVATGDATMLREILSHGAASDDGLGGPLALALHARSPDLAFVLLTEGGATPAPVDAPLDPVRAAIALGSTGGVRLLLDHGLDPDVRDDLDRRPLHVALDMEQFAIAELLLDQGADPYAIDIAGANLGTSATTAMVSAAPEQAAAQRRLAARLPALGWPEPTPAPRALLALASDGNWPPRRH